MSEKLAFREDGTFTMVQFTDLHWMDGRAEDQRTRELMERILEAEQPDLVVFTGDLIYTGPVSPGEKDCEDPAAAFRGAVDAAEKSGIPWAFVFGNHDTENRISREELMKIALEHPQCLAAAGPEELSGSGNYTLEIGGPGGGSAALLYFLDSGAYSEHEQIPGYNWVRRNQINWLAGESERLNPRNRNPRLPALAFFHIPVPEYLEMWNTQTCYGHKYERVCSPHVNSGLFTALLEMGDVAGTFCGHDHVNDFTGSLHGIRLSYGRATGFNTYGKEGFMRGARVIKLTLGRREFDTWLRLEDGSVMQQPVHEPDINAPEH
ncbi:metallophosphoesterase [Paenibacillus sp. PK3_47]|uniref:metallophosphoesterase family protein n=1 Tax=Paenibacillus sp. PK3_47 TaxID=2072642 RepID=UPI00201E2FB2|nr:metallophosphoesterase family protein [Paenibacillus sp. PK3_47]UQZ36260.1 metallophosphoesterase [Paenibacillus sp. PK3_47]